MSAIVRPVFHDGQYIAAADLDAILSYVRRLDTAHGLGSHSWGITAGLELAEKPGIGGQIECWLTSGHATDGFGHSLIVRAALPIGPELLQGKPSGAWFVWIGQRAQQQAQLRASYGVCDGNEAFARVQEQVEVLVTGVLPLTDQQSGVAVADAVRPDARLARRLFNPDGPFQLDGSVPEQDASPLGLKAKWLVPVGLVGWDSAKKSVRALSDIEKQGARLFRRHAGAVAEELLAPGGLLRVRDRSSVVAAGTPDSAVTAAADAIAASAGDLEMVNGRASFRELLWVDGNSRMKGDVRVFGGKFEWRAADGAAPNGPMFMQRILTPKADAELRLALGSPAAKTPMSRLVIGPVVPGSSPEQVQPTLCAGSDGRVGIGTAAPQLTLDIHGDFGNLSGETTAHLGSCYINGAGNGTLTFISGNQTIILGDKDHKVGINTSPAPGNALHIKGTVQIDGPGALKIAGSEFIDANDAILRIRSGGNVVAFDGGDRVGIGTATPAPDFALDINGTFGSNANPARMRLLGSEVIDTGDGILRVRSGGNIVTFDGGDRIGIGTATPAADLSLDVNGAFGSTANPARMRLLGSELIDAGDGILRIRSGGNIVTFDGSDSVGVGTSAPAYLLDVNGDARIAGTLHYFSLVFSSDRRLKTDIGGISNALDRALALKGVSYRWKEIPKGQDANATHFGFVADDVEKVFPDWVGRGPDGMKFVRGESLAALTIEAIRELAERVQALSTENARLKQRIAKLDSQHAAKPKKE
ncbi:tail fiber domain-containing protein [Bradyrhizobium niftali]|uniref:Peptidase S74 domain-containing protein n=1 Tax=Bradyrhizobium niftali TaxID=2560055 RepID=A0A4Y9M3M3_9BRAD|nr:tail fiber domain-containing protein [Bradyrhizobium niftali]TFV49623.1 hypothetical protein E4K65_05330 [Bradyrhizobium niftali]